MKRFTVSIILPLYNEIKNLQKGVLDKVLNYARTHQEIIEVAVVDDGSTDESLSIIKSEYVGRYPKLRLIEKKHSGKAFTVIEGIRRAKGNYVLFSDIDLATPIEEADKLLAAAQNGCEIIIGSRGAERKGGPLLRQIMAKGFILVRNILIGLRGIRDTQCGFKLFEKQAALTIINNLKAFGSEHRVKGSFVGAGFDLEFLFLAAKYRYKIKEIPVIWRHVETKNVSFIKDSLETMRDLLIIKKNDLTHAYEKPSRKKN